MRVGKLAVIRRSVVRVLAALGLLVLSAGLVGCGDERGGDDLGPGDSPNASVAVDLIEYAVRADPAVVEAGAIEFSARNLSSSEVHELAVLRVKADGSYSVEGEIEDISPGAGGSVTLRLAAGKYLLACLIVPGEAGSEKDHFAEGMRLDFEVR
jgi:hypothetical protein